jgi:hypothetical protein
MIPGHQDLSWVLERKKSSEFVAAGNTGPSGQCCQTATFYRFPTKSSLGFTGLVLFRFYFLK